MICRCDSACPKDDLAVAGHLDLVVVDAKLAAKKLDLVLDQTIARLHQRQKKWLLRASAEDTLISRVSQQRAVHRRHLDS